MSKRFKLPQDLSSGDARNWGVYAACKGKPSEWWFADKYNTTEGKIFTIMAKQVCETCTVKAQCLQLSRENDESFGIWGGLTPKERGYKRMNRVF